MTFDAKAYGQQMQTFASALKGAETTVTNAGNTIGRASLIALKAGELSQLSIANAAYAAFKPKSKAGKLCEPKTRGERVESVSSLRNAKGGDAARKQLDALFSVADFIDGDADKDGANIVHPAIEAYIEDKRGCAGGLRALDQLCNEAMRQHVAAMTGQDDVAQDNGDDVAQDNGDDVAQDNTPATIAAQCVSLAEQWLEATPEQRQEADSAMAALMQVVTDLALEECDLQEAA